MADITHLMGLVLRDNKVLICIDKEYIYYVRADNEQISDYKWYSTIKKDRYVPSIFYCLTDSNLEKEEKFQKLSPLLKKCQIIPMDFEVALFRLSLDEPFLDRNIASKIIEIL